MNLRTYINQKDPQRQSPLSVKVKREEIIQTRNFTEYKGMILEIVKIIGYNYILINNKGALWTIDKIGQPKEQSVFYLIN